MELVSLSNVLTALSQTCAQCSMRAPQYNWRRAPLEHHSLRRHGNIRYAWFYFNLRCCSLFCMSDLYYRPVAARQLFSACFRHQLPGPYRAPLCAFRRRHSGYQPHCCVLFFFFDFWILYMGHARHVYLNQHQHLPSLPAASL
jgi:hypothetical protein